jgi:hypothetical protein
MSFIAHLRQELRAGMLTIAGCSEHRNPPQTPQGTSKNIRRSGASVVLPSLSLYVNAA